mmetsp:Transcript_32585/g.127810  ORF Transcript_32585/g.127810 Transcript_32585/m.127810 type:complete len:115 (+) Transcript_32585:566-910(+)
MLSLNTVIGKLGRRSKRGGSIFGNEESRLHSVKNMSCERWANKGHTYGKLSLASKLTTKIPTPASASKPISNQPGSFANAGMMSIISQHTDSLQSPHCGRMLKTPSGERPLRSL